MTQTDAQAEIAVAAVVNDAGKGNLVLVCEHASRFIPAHLADLGLPEAALTSHIAWDPGAALVAEAMARQFDAPLVVSRVSRLIYDCNRPPEAPDAVPERSELTAIPGNAGLDAAARRSRVETYYAPFRALLAETLAPRPEAPLVTIHSFTPVYKGVTREVEIGLLHDTDSRLADAMLDTAPAHTAHDVRRNAPYGPQDGVTHTLKAHALPQGRRNVMIEIRNDLIATRDAQHSMAAMLCGWLSAALALTENLPCRA